MPLVPQHLKTAQAGKEQKHMEKPHQHLNRLTFAEQKIE